jgi:50S ribosomal subunit-associated GTPase HflX
VLISAKFGQNLDALCHQIQKNFSSKMTQQVLLIPHSRMDLVDLFYREGRVEEIKYLQKGIKIKLTLPKILSQKLLHTKDIEIIN